MSAEMRLEGVGEWLANLCRWERGKGWCNCTRVLWSWMTIVDVAAIERGF